MRCRWLVVGAALIACALGSISARAEPSSTEAGRVESGRFAALLRVWDVFKVLPIVFYTPETRLGLGAGALVQYRMPGATAAGRPSSVAFGGVYTLQHQVLAQLTPELRFGDDDYVLKLDALGARYPSRFFGIGNEPRSDVYDRYTDCYVRADLDFRARPFARQSPLAPLYVGANYSAAWNSVADVQPGAPDQPSMLAQLGERSAAAVFSSGLGPSLSWDSRDTLNWPTRGSYVDVRGTGFAHWLGSGARFRRLYVDARRYQPLWRDHVLAMRAVAQAVWGEVPFQRLPQLGGSNMFRGWYAGQLRGRFLVALEAEYRVPLGPRWAVVAFGSVGRVARHLRRFSFDDIHVAGGAGLRLSVDKHSRMNIRLDLAYGDGFYPYLQFREAF